MLVPGELGSATDESVVNDVEAVEEHMVHAYRVPLWQLEMW